MTGMSPLSGNMIPDQASCRGMEGGGVVRGMQNGRYEECLSVCLSV